MGGKEATAHWEQGDSSATISHGTRHKTRRPDGPVKPRKTDSATDAPVDCHNDRLPKSDKPSRNRVAAYKSRAKAQVAVKQLEAEEKVARDRYLELKTEEKELREQVYILKAELLLHADCCPLIQSYVAASAAQIYKDAEE